MKIEKFKLMGIKLPHRTSNVNNQAMIDCGNLWQKFESELIYGKIPNKIDEEIYAVYYDYENDQYGEYSYFIGCKVSDDAISNELEIIEIPTQEYEVKIAKGQMPDCIAEKWREIWAENRKRAFKYDFEVYSEKSQNWGNAEVDIYLGVD